ncbi:hypothetical protein H4R35_003208 [Dimargaris xerosporica]|nr:hypothetical protein H4R35_003208 [Dimargaris xerosporica]
MGGFFACTSLGLTVWSILSRNWTLAHSVTSLVFAAQFLIVGVCGLWAVRYLRRLLRLKRLQITTLTSVSAIIRMQQLEFLIEYGGYCMGFFLVFGLSTLTVHVDVVAGQHLVGSSYALSTIFITLGTVSNVLMLPCTLLFLYPRPYTTLLIMLTLITDETIGLDPALHLMDVQNAPLSHVSTILESIVAHKHRSAQQAAWAPNDLQKSTILPLDEDTRKQLLNESLSKLIQDVNPTDTIQTITTIYSQTNSSMSFHNKLRHSLRSNFSRKSSASGSVSRALSRGSAYSATADHLSIKIPPVPPLPKIQRALGTSRKSDATSGPTTPFTTSSGTSRYSRGTIDSSTFRHPSPAQLPPIPNGSPIFINGDEIEQALYASEDTDMQDLKVTKLSNSSISNWRNNASNASLASVPNKSRSKSTSTPGQRNNVDRSLQLRKKSLIENAQAMRSLTEFSKSNGPPQRRRLPSTIVSSKDLLNASASAKDANFPSQAKSSPEPSTKPSAPDPFQESTSTLVQTTLSPPLYSHPNSPLLTSQHPLGIPITSTISEVSVNEDEQVVPIRPSVIHSSRVVLLPVTGVTNATPSTTTLASEPAEKQPPAKATSPTPRTSLSSIQTTDMEIQTMCKATYFDVASPLMGHTLATDLPLHPQLPSRVSQLQSPVPAYRSPSTPNAEPCPGAPYTIAPLKLGHGASPMVHDDQGPQYPSGSLPRKPHLAEPRTASLSKACSPFDEATLMAFPAASSIPTTTLPTPTFGRAMGLPHSVSEAAIPPASDLVLQSPELAKLAACLNDALPRHSARTRSRANSSSSSSSGFPLIKRKRSLGKTSIDRLTLFSWGFSSESNSAALESLVEVKPISIPPAAHQGPRFLYPSPLPSLDNMWPPRPVEGLPSGIDCEPPAPLTYASSVGTSASVVRSRSTASYISPSTSEFTSDGQSESFEITRLAPLRYRAGSLVPAREAVSAPGPKFDPRLKFSIDTKRRRQIHVLPPIEGTSSSPHRHRSLSTLPPKSRPAPVREWHSAPRPQTMAINDLATHPANRSMEFQIRRNHESSVPLSMVQLGHKVNPKASDDAQSLEFPTQSNPMLPRISVANSGSNLPSGYSSASSRSSSSSLLHSRFNSFGRPLTILQSPIEDPSPRGNSAFGPLMDQGYSFTELTKPHMSMGSSIASFNGQSDFFDPTFLSHPSGCGEPVFNFSEFGLHLSPVTAERSPTTSAHSRGGSSLLSIPSYHRYRQVRRPRPRSCSITSVNSAALTATANETAAPGQGTSDPWPPRHPSADWVTYVPPIVPFHGRNAEVQAKSLAPGIHSAFERVRRYTNCAQCRFIVTNYYTSPKSGLTFLYLSQLYKGLLIHNSDSLFVLNTHAQIEFQRTPIAPLSTLNHVERLLVRDTVGAFRNLLPSWSRHPAPLPEPGHSTSDGRVPGDIVDVFQYRAWNEENAKLAAYGFLNSINWTHGTLSQVNFHVTREPYLVPESHQFAEYPEIDQGPRYPQFRYHVVVTVDGRSSQSQLLLYPSFYKDKVHVKPSWTIKYFHNPPADQPLESLPSSAVIRGVMLTFNSSPYKRVEIDNVMYLAAYLVTPVHQAHAGPEQGKLMMLEMEDTEASPRGWHARNYRHPDRISTYGNNVDAKYAHNSVLARPAVTDQCFNFPPIAKRQFQSVVTKAATTQVFVMLNYMHDFFFHLGFTEVLGNYQKTNFGRGGKENDPIKAFVFIAEPGDHNEFGQFVSTPDGESPSLIFHAHQQQFANDLVDWDISNAAIAHEYTHAVVSRVVGGAAQASCLSEFESQVLAEAWSDFIAAIIGLQEHDLSVPQPVEIQWRGAAGQTESAWSHTIDPSSFTATYDKSQYQLAPLTRWWVKLMLNGYAVFSRKKGYSADWFAPESQVTAGNQIYLRLWFMSLQILPCQPSLHDAREAIRLADRILYKGAHQDLLTKALWDPVTGLSSHSQRRQLFGIRSFLEDNSITESLYKVINEKLQRLEMVVTDNLEFYLTRLLNSRDNDALEGINELERYLTQETNGRVPLAPEEQLGCLLHGNVKLGTS